MCQRNTEEDTDVGPSARRANVQKWQLWNTTELKNVVSLSVTNAKVISALGTPNEQFAENRISQHVTLSQMVVFWIHGNEKFQVNRFYYSIFSLQSISNFQYTGILKDVTEKKTLIWKYWGIIFKRTPLIYILKT